MQHKACVCFFNQGVMSCVDGVNGGLLALAVCMCAMRVSFGFCESLCCQAGGHDMHTAWAQLTKRPATLVLWAGAANKRLMAVSAAISQLLVRIRQGLYAASALVETVVQVKVQYSFFRGCITTCVQPVASSSVIAAAALTGCGSPTNG